MAPFPQITAEKRRKDEVGREKVLGKIRQEEPNSGEKNARDCVKKGSV